MWNNNKKEDFTIDTFDGFESCTQIQHFQQNSNDKNSFPNQRNYRFYHYNRSYQPKSSSPSSHNPPNRTNTKFYPKLRPHRDFHIIPRNGSKYPHTSSLSTKFPAQRRYTNGYNDFKKTTTDNNKSNINNFEKSPNTDWKETEKSTNKNSDSPKSEGKKLKILRHSPLPISAKVSPKKIIEKITKFNKETLKHIISNPTKYDEILQIYQREKAYDEEKKKQIILSDTETERIDEDKGNFEIVPDDVIDLPENFWNCITTTTIPNEKETPQELTDFWNFVLKEPTNEISNDDASDVEKFLKIEKPIELENEVEKSEEIRKIRETEETKKPVEKPKSPRHLKKSKTQKTEQSKKPEKFESLETLEKIETTSQSKKHISQKSKQSKSPVNFEELDKLKHSKESVKQQKPVITKKSESKKIEVVNSHRDKKRSPKTDLMSRIKAAEHFKSSQSKKQKSEPLAASADKLPNKRKSRSKSKSPKLNELNKNEETEIKVSNTETLTKDPSSPGYIIIQSDQPNYSTVISLKSANSTMKQKSESANSRPYSPTTAFEEENNCNNDNRARTVNSPTSLKSADNVENLIKNEVITVSDLSPSTTKTSRSPSNKPSLASISLLTSSSSASSSSSSSSSTDDGSISSASSSRSNSRCSHNISKMNLTEKKHQQLFNQKQEIQKLITIFENKILQRLPPGWRNRYKTKYSTCLDAKVLFISRAFTNRNYNTRKFTRSQICKIKRDLKLPDKGDAIKMLIAEIPNIINKKSETQTVDTAKRKKSLKNEVKKSKLDESKINAEQIDNPIKSIDDDIKVQLNNMSDEDEFKTIETAKAYNPNDSTPQTSQDNENKIITSNQTNVPTINIPTTISNYQLSPILPLTMQQNQSGHWLSRIHEIDINIVDLVKRKEFTDEMIAKLQMDNMELDKKIVNLQKEKFMLLNAALTNATNAANDINPTPTSTIATTVGTTTTTKSTNINQNRNDNQNEKNDDNNKKIIVNLKSKQPTRRKSQLLSPPTSTSSLSSAKPKSRIIKKILTPSKLTFTKNKIKSILAAQERPNLSDKENEATTIKYNNHNNSNTNSLEAVNLNIFDYSKIPIGHLTGIESAVNQVCIYKDCIIGATENGLLYTFDITTQKVAEQIQKHDLTITQMIFDEKRLALFTISLDGYLKQTLLNDLKSVKQSVNLEEQLQSLDMQWDFAFIGTRSGNIFKCNIAHTELLPEPLCIGDSSVMAIKATKEGARKIIIISSKENVILFRDAINGLLLRTMQVSDNLCVYGFLFDESHLYCGTQRQQILKFEFTSCAHISTFYCGNGVVAMKFYKNKFLIAVCYDGYIYFLNKVTGEVIIKLPASGRLPLTLEIIGNKLLTSSKDKNMEIIDIPQQIVNG